MTVMVVRQGIGFGLVWVIILMLSWLKLLMFLPNSIIYQIIDQTYGNPEEWVVQATNFKISGECLVEVYFEPVDSSALAHFNEYYQDYNCELEPDDYPLGAFKFELKGERLILTP